MPDLKTIADLLPDTDNANRHTEHGMGILEDHLRVDGAGRSILLDADGKVIAGNGVIQAAAQAGITAIKTVETEGDELVVVVRKDVTLDSQRGRRMALADNAIAAKNLDLDEDVIRRQAAQYAIDLDGVALSQEDMAAIRREAKKTEASEGTSKETTNDLHLPVLGEDRKPGAQVRYFKFGDNEIPMTHTEYANIIERLHEYSEAHEGSSDGFVTDLLGLAE